MFVIGFVQNYQESLRSYRFVLRRRLQKHHYYIKSRSVVWLTTCGSWVRRRLYSRGRDVTWDFCCSFQTDSPSDHKTEERSYKFRLPAIFGGMKKEVDNGDIIQSLIVLLVSFCCLDALYSSGWYHVSHPHSIGCLEFKHCTCERRTRRLFAGWHSVKLYATRPTKRASFNASLFSSA